MTETATQNRIAIFKSRERFFRTDHLHADLKRRSTRGGAVTLAAQMLRFLVQMISTAVLARLLTPEDFGLVAMVAAFIGFAALFNDLGLSTATIQYADITHSQVSTLFWINVAISFALAGLGMALAPFIAWFYGEPRLTWVTIVLSATFILGGLSAQHYALLVRRMRFKAMAVIQVGSLCVGVAIGIILAVFGYGYWSLVGMGIATSLTVVIGSWLLTGWCPSLPRGSKDLNSMLGFGTSLTGSNVLTYVMRNLDNILIGRGCGSVSLGFYAKAYGLVLLPLQQISSPLNGVLLPTLSRLQDQPSRYRTYYLTAIELLAFVSMALVAFAFVDAKYLVLTILGPQWTGSVPLFKLLAPAAFVGTVSIGAQWVLISLGQAGRLLKWSFLSGILTIAAFLIGLHWGASGVAAGFSIVSCLVVIPMFWWALRYSPVRLSEWSASLARPLFAAVSAAIIFFLIRQDINVFTWPLLGLMVDAFIYSFIYLGIFILLPGSRQFITAIISVFKH